MSIAAVDYDRPMNQGSRAFMFTSFPIIIACAAPPRWLHVSRDLPVLAWRIAVSLPFTHIWGDGRFPPRLSTGTMRIHARSAKSGACLNIDPDSSVTRMTREQQESRRPNERRAHARADPE
jgi:hypothetical protein